MSGKATAIIVSLSMVALVAGIVTYAVIHSSSKETSYAPVPQSIAANEAITQDGNSAVLGTGSNAGTVGDGIGLQSNLGVSSGPASSGGSSAPAASQQSSGPETFAQYDQYKDGQSALFADFIVGTGTEVTGSSKVAVTYQGWLTNGTLFDESKKNDEGKLEAFTFQMGGQQVIPGWEQAILGMKVGGKRRLVVPPAVGYGTAGHDPIPPNAVLVFDVIVHAAL